jgi:hypothetical protein
MILISVSVFQETDSPLFLLLNAIKLMHHNVCECFFFRKLQTFTAISVSIFQATALLGITDK